MSINDTPPDPVQVRPPAGTGQTATAQRTDPDWITYRGYAVIVIATLAMFFLIQQATGWAQLVSVVIWVAAIAAVISFTRHDRRRRTIREEK